MDRKIESLLQAREHHDDGGEDDEGRGVAPPVVYEDEGVGEEDEAGEEEEVGEVVVAEGHLEVLHLDRRGHLRLDGEDVVDHGALEVGPARRGLPVRVHGAGGGRGRAGGRAGGRVPAPGREDEAQALLVHGEERVAAVALVAGEEVALALGEEVVWQQPRRAEDVPGARVLLVGWFVLVILRVDAVQVPVEDFLCGEEVSL
jgi:hypothetical protein